MLTFKINVPEIMIEEVPLTQELIDTLTFIAGMELAEVEFPMKSAPIAKLIRYRLIREIGRRYYRKSPFAVVVITEKGKKVFKQLEILDAIIKGGVE